MNFSPSSSEVLICSADARRQVVTCDGGNECRPTISSSAAALPRDFDDARYLELNPDLANADIDLRKHYLLSGQKEKRRYRRLDLSEAITSPRLMLQRIRQQTFLRKF
jgi:hypothetical protein